MQLNYRVFKVSYKEVTNMAIMRSDPFRLHNWPVLWDWDEEDSAPVAASNLEIYETSEDVVVRANVPGVTEKDIDLTFEKGVLWIRAEVEGKKDESQTDRKYYYRASRDYSYKINVPGSVDWQKEPQADLSDGVLTVNFKKSEVDKPKRIAVKSTRQK
jgi:HSP20 family protein